MCGIGLAVITIWQYNRINLTAQILQKVGVSLRETGCSTWMSVLFLQICFLLVFAIFTWVGLSSFYVWDLHENSKGECVIERSVISRNLQTVSSLLFAWVCSFLQSARLMVVAAPTVCWYFPQLADTAPAHPSFRALGWCFSTSVGTLSLSGLIATIASKAEEAATARRGRCCGDTHRCCSCDCINPIGVIFQLIWYLLESCAVTATRFALIAHLFRAKNFWDSARSAYRTMESRGVVGGYVVGQAGESVVTMGAYVFSLIVGLLVWEYVDAVEELGTMDHFASSVTKQILFYFLFILYLILTYYPLFTIVITVVISEYLPEVLLPFLTALFMACTAHLLFGYLGDVIMSAVYTLYFCYCIDLEKQRKQQSTASGTPTAPTQEPGFRGTAPRDSGEKDQMELGDLFLKLESSAGFIPRPSAPPLDPSDTDDEEKWIPAWGVVLEGPQDQSLNPSAPPGAIAGYPPDAPAGSIGGPDERIHLDAKNDKNYDTFD
mmetsp:Transcript_12558/g.17408  ORF Transcript_12558/g.17408 Transcript_12558/m.17408 type:complete len:493 (-) Transcript_12558:44-1522(-)